jgi:hypothetical protein
MVVEVFHQAGDPAFVSGAHGRITGGMIEDIEKELTNEDFNRGDGLYLFVPTWVHPQIGDEGRVELPGYWDLELVGFKTIEDTMANATVHQTPERSVGGVVPPVVGNSGQEDRR